MANPEDLRQHKRIDFLAAQHDADSLPGWVFKPVQFSHGPAGLVLNMSDGGLQVLTSANEPLTEAKYEVVLLLGRSDVDDEEEQVSWFNGVVERKWSRPVPAWASCTACASRRAIPPPSSSSRATRWSWRTATGCAACC